MRDNYFINKRVLITGITGFVGSALAQRMRALGADVYGISQSIRGKKNLNASILDYSVINQFIKETKIQICFHLAGKSLVEAGQVDPYHTFKVNTEGTLNILECGRKNNLEKIIIASTTHVYGQNKIPYFEGYTPRPSRPYETSKACTDLIAQSYASSFNLAVLIPRFVNIYGPGDVNFNRLIPKTIKSVLTEEQVTIWGGDVIRDYLYIDDAVDAYIQLVSIDLKKVGDNRIFNFGAGEQTSVRDVVKKIINLTGREITIKKNKEQRNEEIKIQYVSFAKATKILKWKPKTTLDEGLKKSILWYKEYFKDKIIA